MAIAGALNILVINPNITSSMTTALEPAINGLLSYHKAVSCDFFTAPLSSESHPGALSSINSPEDAYNSALYCFEYLKTKIHEYDGFLVACYSEHPLVGMLGREVENVEMQTNGSERRKKKYVIGIFEASVITSLGLLAQLPRNGHKEQSMFGIVSTGKVWEEALSRAVGTFLGMSLDGSSSHRFAGVETTGLTATELHDLPAEEVKEKMSAAAARLINKPRGNGEVMVICLGCAGMVGLEDAVREGVANVLGRDAGEQVKIVDGVVAGFEWLVSACRMGF